MKCGYESWTTDKSFKRTLPSKEGIVRSVLLLISVVLGSIGVVVVVGKDGEGLILVVHVVAGVTNTLQALFSTKLRTRSSLP